MQTMPYIIKLQTEIPCLVLYEVLNKSKAMLCTAFGILLYDIFPVFSPFINIKPCVHFGIDSKLSEWRHIGWVIMGNSYMPIHWSQYSTNYLSMNWSIWNERKITNIFTPCQRFGSLYFSYFRRAFQIQPQSPAHCSIRNETQSEWALPDLATSILVTRAKA